MADNLNVTPGSGAIVSAENITVSGASVLLQRVKLAIGSYDVDNGDVASNNPMPVVQSTPDSTRTLVVTTGTLSATNGTLVISSSSQRIKVYAFSITTTSSTQQIVNFQSGVGGTNLWSVALQAPAGASAGANLAVFPPGYIFSVPTGNVLNLNLSSTNAVVYSIAYFLET